MQTDIPATLTEAWYSYYTNCHKHDPGVRPGEAIVITAVHRETGTVDFVTVRFQRVCTGQPLHLFPEVLAVEG